MSFPLLRASRQLFVGRHPGKRCSRLLNGEDKDRHIHMAIHRKSSSPQIAAYRHHLTHQVVHRTPRVLIVDDEELGTELRVAVLRSLGYDTAMSKSGAEAVARPDIDTFDVIVLDYDMPKLNGVQTARKLRKSGVDAKLVMLSGRVDAPSRSKKLIDVFVSKGEGVPNLTSAIQKALDKRTYH